MFLDDIRTKLLTEGIAGGATGWTVYIGHAPDTSDKIIVLALTGGFLQDTHQSTNFWHSIQVRVRSSQLDHNGCYTKWLAVFNSLNAQTVTGSGVFLLDAFNSGPIHLNDDRQRPIMITNYRVGVAQ